MKKISLTPKYEFSSKTAADPRKRPSVFQLSPDVVGKIMLYYHADASELQKSRLDNFYNEYRIHKKAYELSLANKGFNIGKVYDFTFAKNLDDGLEYPMIVMEDLGRKVVYKLEDIVEKTKAENLFNEQVKFAEKLGFTPRDCETYNAMLKDEKVYLFDFACWRYNGELDD